MTLFFLVAGVSAYAQPDIEKCKELARENYPVIRQYDLISQTEDYTLTTASRAWLPQVALSAQATYQSDVVKWPDQFESMLAAQGLDMPGLRKDQYKVQVDVQQTIWDGGKGKVEKELAQMEAQQSRMSTDVELYALGERIEDLYFGILLLQEQELQFMAVMDRLKNNLNHVNALVSEGVAMQADADALQVQILTSNQTLTQIRSQLKSFRRMLEIFIGEPLGDCALVRPEAVEPLGDKSLRPELVMFDAKLGVLQTKEKMIDVSLVPKFSLFAQGYYGYPGLNMFENMISSKWSLNGIAGVRMVWNISSFYNSDLSRKQLQNAMANVQLQKDIFAFNNRLQAEKENAEISRIREVLRDDDEIVRLRSNVREAAELRLKEGIIDTNSLLNKISDESAAMISRSTHEIELLKAIYDLKHTLNR